MFSKTTTPRSTSGRSRHSYSAQRSYATTTSTFEKAPYQTWRSFEKATKNNFHPLCYQGKLLKTAHEVQQEAWRIYSSTQNADDKRFKEFPFAITYTGADYNVLQKLKNYPCFNKNEDLNSLQKSGWIYIPELLHTWGLNGIWVLSNVHKGRSFVSVSDACFKFSAYTKELHCMFKSGYKVTSLTFLNDGHTLVHLTPPALDLALQVKLSDFLDISPEDCEKAQIRFNSEKRALIQKAHPTDQKIFSNIIAVAQANAHANKGLFFGSFRIPHLTLFSLQNKLIPPNEAFVPLVFRSTL